MEVLSQKIKDTDLQEKRYSMLDCIVGILKP